MRAVHSEDPADEDMQWAVLGFDIALLALYLWLALRTKRHWPLFTASFQLLIVIIHVARIADPSVSGWAYLTAQLLFSYLVLFTIGYAAWTAPRRAQDGADSAAELPR